MALAHAPVTHVVYRNPTATLSIGEYESTQVNLEISCLIQSLHLKNDASASYVAKKTLLQLQDSIKPIMECYKSTLTCYAQIHLPCTHLTKRTADQVHKALEELARNCHRLKAVAVRDMIFSSTILYILKTNPNIQVPEHDAIDVHKSGNQATKAYGRRRFL